MSIQYMALDRCYGRQRSWNGSVPESRPSVAVLACSSSSYANDSPLTTLYPHRLCEDRKGFIDHLYPYSLGKSTMRIVIMQGSTVATQYMNDQLKEEMRRDELVACGKISQMEADEEAAQWSEQEWKRRWEAFPQKLATAFAKYHCIILLMRLYEKIADSFADKMVLDSLTLDTFDYAKRASNSGKEGRELASNVFQTSLKAGLITYLADFSVHEFILLYGYYVYVQEQRRRNKKKLGLSSEEEIVAQSLNITMTLVKNSTLLLISRAVGLVMSSFGAAIGSCMVPGWGTLLGANLGDGLAMGITDELITISPSMG